MAKPNNKNLAILRLGLVASTMLVVRWIFPMTQEPAQAALVTVTYACAALFAVLLFRSVQKYHASGLLYWCFAVTALLAAVLIADPLTRQMLPLMPRLIVTFFLLAATVLIASQRVSTEVAATGLATLTFIPIWAAPAIELAGNPAAISNTVVAASPLSVLALSLDLDYLRTSWFYSHSALGSMRYDYPEWLIVCAILSLLPVAALLRPIQYLPNRLVKEAHQ
jgi:hypothetical protein